MFRSNSAPRRSLFLAGLALCAAVAASPRPAAAADADTVRAFYNVLLQTMRAGPSLGAQGRYLRLAPSIQQTFDIPFMTQLAIGPDWNTLNATQQAQVMQAFERYIAAIYAERFHSYAGEQLQVTGQTSSPAGIVITSQIIKSSGEPVHINYLMRNGKVADVYLNGTISELATRRSEFSGILRTQGINGLITALNNKAAALAS